MGSYVPNSPAVRQQMLEAMGAASIRDLYANVPEDCRSLRRMPSQPY